MNYKNINIPLIKYNKSQISYDNKKLLIELPVLKSKSSIEKYFNKYQLLLNIDDEELLNFIYSLENNNKKYCRKDSFYKSNINSYNNTLILKVPFRYNRHEINITSDNIYLPTIEDIKPDMLLKCKILVSKIWNYNTNDKQMSGCIMEVKEIYIV